MRRILQPWHINARILKTHYKYCEIDGHIEEKCWNLHLEINLKDRKKDSKKKNLLAMEWSKDLEGTSNVNGNIIYPTVKNEVNISSLHPK